MAGTPAVAGSKEDTAGTVMTQIRGHGSMVYADRSCSWCNLTGPRVTVRVVLDGCRCK